jgi:hypothetical protein
MKRALMLFASLALVPSAAFPAITLHTADFIPDNTRTNFNGFEAIAPLSVNTYTNGSYTEDGVTVENPTDVGLNTNIATACIGPGFCFNPSHEGARSWYPDGGDLGYTRITRVGGVDFVNVGFILGSGFGSTPEDVYYELAEGGVVVKSGRVPGLTNTPSYLGFSGGGFDEIRLRNGFEPQFTLLDGTRNALAVDSIELSSTVPEPSAWALLAGGLIMLGFTRASPDVVRAFRHRSYRS